MFEQFAAMVAAATSEMQRGVMTAEDFFFRVAQLVDDLEFENEEIEARAARDRDDWQQ